MNAAAALAELLGVALVVAGVAMLSPAIAVIVAGFVVAAGGFALEDRRHAPAGERVRQ
jgi:divalent metal cation (Fe/Co/Zn/Cd) transporter